ncbi:MAG: substrate-binding domain-containing protein [Armatimonadetes bacterium]|nr:substrate-binding domain-containing protein [Armatimonadota bacterium]
MIRIAPNFILAASVLAALFVAGCNGGSSTESSSASTSTSGGGGSKLKVVFIPKDAANPYFKQVDAGLQDAAKEFGFDYQQQGPATADATSQLTIIKDQIQRHVDVIVLSANSPDALNEALDDARAKGIVVVTVDADLTGNESHRDVGILPTSPEKIGQGQVELLGKEMNYQGDFAILSATTDAPNQNAWIAIMKKTLEDPKYAKMKLVDTVYGNDEAQKSSTEMEGLLTKYPNLKGVVSPTSVGFAAAAQVLENSGMYPGGAKAVNGGIYLTGLSTPNQLKKFVQNGTITAFQLWQPKDMGYLAGYLGTAAKEKKIELKFGAEVTGPKGDKLKLDDKGVVFAGDLLTFDKSNIDKYDY